MVVSSVAWCYPYEVHVYEWGIGIGVMMRQDVAMNGLWFMK